MITYQKALTNLHNRSLCSRANKMRIIRETKMLQELVDKAEVIEPVVVDGVKCCPMCGDKLESESRYCSWCGQRVAE